MPNPLLICTDLDRTLLPNGAQPESPGARERFQRLADDDNTLIVYATGRDKGLVDEAIAQYQLPYPDFLIADVGSSIYSREDNQWVQWQGWRERLKEDWDGYSREQMTQLFPLSEQVTSQDEFHQGEFKLSFMIEPADALDGVLESYEQIIAEQELHCHCIASENEFDNHGLIDILPTRANKLFALEYLIEKMAFDPQQVLFSGDSGNDIQVLASHFPSVLVANATDSIKSKAIAMAKLNGNSDRLYLAKGMSPELNGCYAAGIIEGLHHFYPQFGFELT